jgi:hypothetical protein
MLKIMAIAISFASAILLVLLSVTVSGGAHWPSLELEEAGGAPVGPLEVTYENCSEPQQTAIQAALTGINGQVTGACKDKIGSDLQKCLEGKTGNIEVKCGGGSCDEDSTVEGAAPLGGSYVRVCEQTFNNPERLEAVLFHELVHSCGKDSEDKVAEACQNACYEGKGATAPDEGEDGGSCKEPTVTPVPNGNDNADEGEDGGSCKEPGLTAAVTYLPRVSPQNSSPTVTIASDKQVYAYGESMTITFQLQNLSSSETITVNKTWHNPNFNTLLIFDSQGQQWKSNILWEMRPPDCANFATLLPGGVFSDTFAITPEYYGILPTGQYTMWVVYYNLQSGCYFPFYPYLPDHDLGAWTTWGVSTNLITFHVTVTNTAPIIAGLPDQTLEANDHLDNAIDLWAYASDAESPDSDLSFNIDNTPVPSAGVSIDSNRYVDINPAPDWAGQTDVVIRVTDPSSLYATDTFSVEVESKTFCYLPIIIRGASPPLALVRFH